MKSLTNRFSLFLRFHAGAWKRKDMFNKRVLTGARRAVPLWESKRISHQNNPFVCRGEGGELATGGKT
ncbi:MAG: hypothetical protein KKD44_15650 [Proteobacteria bacterium]|nr:hypothetical protein [Pseudomonadota bacterium]